MGEPSNSGGTEAALLELSRDALLGNLLSAVAHALNNHLSAVVGYLDLLLANPAAAHLRHELDRTLSSALAGMELTRTLALLKNALAEEASSVNPGVALEAMVKILESIYRSKGLTVSADLGGQAVCVAPARFVQVASTLTFSAAEAALTLPAGQRHLRVVLAQRPLELELTLSGPGSALEAWAHPPASGELEPHQAALTGANARWEAAQVLARKFGRLSIDLDRGCIVLTWPLSK